MEKRVSVIGVPISATTLLDALQYLHENEAAARQSYICAANVHTTVTAHENAAYRAVLAQSFLTLPDGKPLSVWGRKHGCPEMQQVRGVDLMRALLQEPGARHYFYGNTPEHLQALISAIQTDYPECCIAGSEPSVFRELSDAEVEQLAQRIKAAKTDYLWVGLGAPRQEIFCARIAGKTDATALAVGGAFNVLAHIVPDAPEWMRKCGLEWLYRFLREPRRLLKRYLVTNSKFLFYCLTDRTHE